MHSTSEHLIYEANSNRTEGRNKQEYNNSINFIIYNNIIIFVLYCIIIKLFLRNYLRICQYPTLNNVWTNQTEKLIRDHRVEQHYRPNKHNRHIQIIPFNSIIIHILIQCTYNIIKGRSQVSPQNKF